MEDLIKPHFPNMTETKATFLSKGLGELPLLLLLLLLFPPPPVPWTSTTVKNQT